MGYLAIILVAALSILIGSNAQQIFYNSKMEPNEVIEFSNGTLMVSSYKSEETLNIYSQLDSPIVPLNDTNPNTYCYTKYGVESKKLLEEKKDTRCLCENAYGDCGIEGSYCKSWDWGISVGVEFIPALSASFGVSETKCTGTLYYCQQGDQKYTRQLVDRRRKTYEGKVEWHRNCMGAPSTGLKKYKVTVTDKLSYFCNRGAHKFPGSCYN